MKMTRRVNGGGIQIGYLDQATGSNSNRIASSSSSSIFHPLSKHLDLNSSPSFSADGAGDLGNIVHSVSKFDTLAGVAIKYGVEVADIKKLNGLVSDVQMFALNTLQIPLPGRHPPSPIQSSSFDGQGESSRHSDLFNTFQSLKLKSLSDISTSTSSLQLHDYCLKMTDPKYKLESFENVYRNGGDHYLQDEHFDKPSTPKAPVVGLHRKSKSVANGFLTLVDLAEDESATNKGSRDDPDKWIKRMHVRRRQKSEADFKIYTQQMLAKEENSSWSGADSEAAGQQNRIYAGLGDSSISNVVNEMRRSSSTANLQESDNSTLLSLWPASKWSLKTDLNALATATIARPIFDGIPISGRKNKSAVD